jgi:hypothetical protein
MLSVGLFAQFLQGPLRGGDANHRHAENAAPGHRVERRKNHLVDEIAGHAKDDQCISRGRAAIAIVQLGAPRSDSSACASLEQQPEVRGGQGVAEKIALAFVALLGPEECELLVRFHAFGNDPIVEVLAHPDHGADDGGVVRIGGDIAHEGLIDLDRVDRESLQVYRL